jgi:hypothetical protein
MVSKDAPMLSAMVLLSAQYPRYGYRRFAGFHSILCDLLDIGSPNGIAWSSSTPEAMAKVLRVVC